MSEAAPVPDAERTITSVDTLRVVSHPLRLQILEMLVEPRTVKQVALAFGTTPTKLYYHVNLLEKHGLVRVVGTRLVSGIVEKRYQASACTFRVDHRLLSLGAAEGERGLDAFLEAVLDTTKGDVRDGVQTGLIDLSDSAPPRLKLLLTRALGRLTPDQAREFYARLEGFVRELDATRTEPEPEESQLYRLAIALYPTEHRVPSKAEAESTGDEGGSEHDLSARSG